MESNKVVVGVIAGVAIGALVGVLFAPAKGSKTRKRVMNKATAYKDELQSKIEDLVDGVSDQYDALLHDVQNEHSDHTIK
ncbi:MAG: YtxH domain-containing protein [Flavobacterium sp.]|nr:YtxH domain-containing protein [Flavobacterium sp.]